MEREALKLAFEAHRKDERHHTVAETRYWCNQYKLLAHQAIEALAQPEQEPVAFEEWLSKQHGDPEEIGFLQALRIAYISGQDSIITPPQRTWVGLTGNEWFEWWRISKVADATEAEIDFADFLIIAHAVITKLKEKNG